MTASKYPLGGPGQSLQVAMRDNHITIPLWCSLPVVSLRSRKVEP